MNRRIAIPTVISSLRIVALPILLYFYTLGNVVACLGVLVFCALTDYLDGYLARKLCVSSRFGAYFDAATDFALMLGMYAYFVFDSFYPLWLPILIVAAFLQFVVTSRYIKKIYDPVGRYLGSALYIGVVLTLLWPAPLVLAFVQYAFVGFFLVSLASRILSLKRMAKLK
jgi:CDP-diacylglycerol---glycerol-3-phosphate 3-phosphatidyltransferase